MAFNFNPYRVQVLSPEEKRRQLVIENERTKLMAEALTNLGLLFVGAFLITPLAEKMDFSYLGSNGTWIFVLVGMALHSLSHYLLKQMS